MRPIHGGVKEIVKILKDEYDIWVCPNGGEMADKVFRVDNIGYITKENNNKLVDILLDMNQIGLL